MTRDRDRERDRERDRRVKSRSNSRERYDNRDSNRKHDDYVRGNNRKRSRSNSNDHNKNNKNDNIKIENNNNNNNEVKAIVTETDGEISCSIEETNRIRALLGLKPLNNEKPKEKQAVDNFKAQKEEEEKRREAEKLKEQITKAKNKRLLNEKLKGSTLADINENENDSELVSASDWVKRSRKKELTDKEKAELLEKRLLEEEEENKKEYSSKDLKGMQIKHSMNDFEAGFIKIIIIFTILLSILTIHMIIIR